MCRVDERIYVRADGHRSKFQDTSLCDRGKRRSKMCSNVDVRRTEYPDPTSSPIASSLLTPNYHTQARRLSVSSRPSTREGSIKSLKPEIHIGLTMSNGTPHVSITTGKSKRESPGSTSAHESAGSEASYTGQTGFLDASPPSLSSSHSGLRPQSGHYHNLSSDESIPSSSRLSHAYTNSSDYETPSLATGTIASSSGTRPFIHHAPRTSTMPAQINTTVGQGNGPASPYRTTDCAPREVYTETIARTERGQRPTSYYGSSVAPEITERADARERQRAEARKLQEALDRQHAAAQAQEENTKHVRFSEKDRGKLRAEERAQNNYALHEQRRAEERERLGEQDRKDREAQAARDEAKKRTKQAPPTKPFRRGSVSQAAAQAAEQQRLVAAEEALMQHERLRAEALEREEHMAQQLQQQRPAYQERVRSSLQERAQDPRHYDPRGTVAAPGIGRRGSHSRQTRPALVRTPSERGDVPQAREARQQHQPPVSFYNNAPRNEIPQAREPRRPSCSHGNRPFMSSAPPSAPTVDPWDVRNMAQANLEQYQSPVSQIALQPYQDNVVSRVSSRASSVLTIESPESAPASSADGQIDLQQIHAFSHDLLHETDETRSESSYAASLFSIPSIASSASDLSKHSHYSSRQIATATKELFDIFLRDPDLIKLYQRAISLPEIGPERLQRNLRRLLKAYAKNLEDEHTESLEYLASKLVAIQSGPLARAIVGKYYCAPTEEGEACTVQDDSSEDEVDVDEKIFGDLKAFREFLTSATAYETFRAQMRSFVIPKPQQPNRTEQDESEDISLEPTTHKDVKTATIAITWQSWRANFAEAVDILLIKRELGLATKAAFHLAFDAFALATDPVLITVGILEPLLPPETVRLRWRCKCGDQLFSDVTELQENGVPELATRMEDSSGVKVAIAGYNQYSGNQQYTLPRHLAWFRRSNGACHSNQAAKIPTPSSTLSSSATTATSTPSHGTSTQKQMLHLLACMHNKRSSKILQQDRIEDVATDCELIRFLRCQYRKRRSRLRSFLSLKTVQGIHFVKFHLPMGDNVIIRPHGVSCIPLDSVSTTTPMAICECLPPRARVEPADTAEYHCQPVPPKTFPPVPPEYLLSLFTCQEQPHQMSRWIVEQLPKRKWGELFGKPEQPAEGWGIYYKEGWDTGLIAIVVFLLLSASLLFSILWTTLRDDIQGAFGVGAWMVGIGGALLAVIVTQADSF
ncbi:hypothetical protein E8E12_003449 [Didymella heteroderae]|uniref:Uncharacterized protein n=1 Tax=Didymella heteroderae TaxID=1769908 RepID=A0A9P4WHH9_9PLEO|nr:hypothetical protein E8E12_003449 [Didymella heteroderae]